jgi:hypothetical protein
MPADTGGAMLGRVERDTPELPEIRNIAKESGGAASRLEDWGSFQIEFEYRETCVYWEHDRGCAFMSAWGVRPYVTLVPAADEWDQVVPTWMRGRRREVLARLAQSSTHRLEVWRVLPRIQRHGPGYGIAERWGPPGPKFSGRPSAE